MATPAQIRANIQNSARSTGPRTRAGKEESRKNSLKHGFTGAGVVLRAEDQEKLAAKVDAYAEALGPADEAEADSVRNAAAETRAARAGRTLDLDTLERRAIQQALDQHHGNISSAAQALGLSRPALYRRMSKHGLQ